MAASTVASAYNSTSHSNHPSSVTNVEDPEFLVTLDEDRPFLEVDFQSIREVELDHFLASLVKLDMESLRNADQKWDLDVLKGELEKIEKTLKTITTNPVVLELRDAYCTSAKDFPGIEERARYGPFAELANKIIELLCKTEDNSKTKDIPIAFCRNYPHRLGNAFGNIRTPDVVVIDGSHKSVKDGEWTLYPNIVSGTPRDTRYTWADVLFTVEFELRDDLIPVGELSADVEPEFVPQMSRRSVSSTQIGGEIMSSPCAPSTSHFRSLPDEMVAVSSDWPSGSALLSASRDTFAESLSLGKTSKHKKSGVRGPVAMYKSRGRGKSNREERHAMSEPVQDFNTPLGSSVGGKRKFSGKTETEVSRTKKPRIDGNSDKVPAELFEQGLCHAIEQLSYLHNVRRAFDALVVDGIMWICYYDHTGIILTSQPIDFVNDLFRFVLLLKGMMGMSRIKYGILDHIMRIEDKGPLPVLNSNDGAKVGASPNIIEDKSVLGVARKKVQSKSDNLIAQFGLSIKGQVFRFIRRLLNARLYGLLGKATAVVEAKLVRLEGSAVVGPIEIGKVVAVKMSWPPKSQISEVVTIKRAREILQGLDNKDEDYRKTNGIKGKLEDCLPVVYESEDRDDLVGAKGCFRQRLNMLEFVDGVENRVWRTIVFEVLVPIYMLDDLGKFKVCFRGIFQGHHFLWEEGFMHRDISIGNLMCRIREDGRVCGVLNDWDLAKLKESTEPTSNSRTGTRPFMARDLLTDEPREHLERFDWESMLYVLIWVACHYGSGGVLEKPNALPVWLEHDLGRLRDNKSSVCGGEYPSLTEYYEELTSWIDPMITLFWFGYKVKASYEKAKEKSTGAGTFDSETLGGHVTYKKLREIYRL